MEIIYNYVDTQPEFEYATKLNHLGLFPVLKSVNVEISI